MRRVVLTGVATAILIAVPQSAWANILFSNTAFWAKYPQIGASGSGVLTQAGKGYVQGQVVGGRIQVQGSVRVVGAINPRLSKTTGTVRTYVARSGGTMYVSTSGTNWWRFVVNGRVSIDGWVRGSASAIGTGKYTVNGHRHAWSLYSLFRISTW